MRILTKKNVMICGTSLKFIMLGKYRFRSAVKDNCLSLCMSTLTNNAEEL